MSRHQKRLSVPTSWPVERKTNVFTVKASGGPHGEDGVPLLILLRDVLGYVDSRKEARYALDHDAVLVNGVAINDEARPIGMFDILSFPDRDEHYRVFPDEGGRLSLTLIEADAADSRLGKVEGKRQAPGGHTQLSLHDGTNLTVDATDEYSRNDSIVIDNEDGSIVAHFPYKEGAMVTAVSGNHGGKIGHVESINVTPGSGSNTVVVETLDGEGRFETVEEYVVVIDENFIDEDDEPVADPDESTTDETEESSDADEETGGESDVDVDEIDEKSEGGEE